MISGLNSSSISLAMRTAQRAEKTVAKTVEQIATGKKVASVKDDAAGFIISEALKSKASELQTKAQMIEGAIGMNQFPILSGAHASEMTSALRDIVLSAIANIDNASFRNNLANEFSEQVQTAAVGQNNFLNNMSVDGVFWSNDASDSWGTWHLPFANISDMADIQLRRGVWSFSSAYSSYVTTIQSGNLTSLNTLLASLNTAIGSYASASLVASSENAQMVARKDNFNNMADNLNSFASSFTDADMGKVSAQRDMAQTRQQLAYQTVRNAIAQYGNIAGGLLNNVMGTQRSVRA